MSTPLRVLQLNGAAYGWLLALTTLLSLIVIAHYPAAVPHNMAALGNTDLWGHALAILAVLLLTTGMSGFAWRLGIAHPLVMAGWLSQVFGALVLIGAGLQADPKLGLVLTALSAVFLGHALLHHRGGALWIGLLGIGAGGFSAVFVLTLTARFNPPLLLAYMTGQTVWYLTVAFWMIRGLRKPD